MKGRNLNESGYPRGEKGYRGGGKGMKGRGERPVENRLDVSLAKKKRGKIRNILLESGKKG